MTGFKTIEYNKKDNELVILDQTKLPEEEVYLKLKSVEDIYQAIKNMNLRGAPLIGVTAAYGVVLAASKGNLDEIIKAADYIKSARPTAVNLAWAIERMKKKIKKSPFNSPFEKGKIPLSSPFEKGKIPLSSPFEKGKIPLSSPFEKGGYRGIIYKILLKEAQDIENEDKESCQRIGKSGAELINDNTKIMVYCNAGALATSGIGTALGILYTAKNRGKKFTVYSCETRPLLQGARLTSWELTKNGIETYTICDNMAATYMPEMDFALVGADRIASNGDTANKIGTRSLSIIAHYYKVPFYVAAPISTFDLNIKIGKDIPIEIRYEDEIRKFNNKNIVAKNAKVCNPAFDVTPADLITGIITEKGIIKPPYEEKIAQLINDR